MTSGDAPQITNRALVASIALLGLTPRSLCSSVGNFAVTWSCTGLAA